MKLPMILVNFKTYLEATGKNAVKMAKICELVSKKYGVNIAVAPEVLDLSEVASRVEIPVFAQHIDPIAKDGKHTGHVIAENVKAVGAVGTILNHSERRLKLEEIGECVNIAKNFGLITVCCSESPRESEEIAKFGPDFIAYEPPELIGSGVSVSKTKPDVVKETVDLIKRVNPNVKVLCGAGITTGEDVKRAIELGTVGVLVASGVVKAENPKKVLEEFARAIR